MSEKKPVYLKLKEDILRKVTEGVYHKDMRLPSETEMGRQWNISRMTVRRALDELAREGVLYRVRGSGTYVSADRLSQQDVMSFSDVARSHGSVPGSRVLETVFGCDEPAAEALHLPKGTVFYKIRRLRLSNEMPIGIEQVFLPLQYCEKPDKLKLDGSLYEELRREMGWVVARQDIAVTAQQANEEERVLLEMHKGDAVLKTDGVSMDSEGRSLFYERNTYSGDGYTMMVSIRSRR